MSSSSPAAEMSRHDASQLFNLKWKNYQNHLIQVFDKMLVTESFADVTLVCCDTDHETTQAIKAHKMILGASSPYFEIVFAEHPCQHPVVVMPPEVRVEELQHVLQFIYKGEVQVPQEQLEPVLRVASQLKIRGLDSDYSRESSLEPDRPGSQQSGSSKRKNSPKFHFLKNRRKNLVPAKREREEKEDDNASLNEEENGQEDMESPEQTMTEGPVDFTVKCEEEEQAKEEMEGVQPDMSDMAAFIASATAAVRNAGGNSFQDLQHTMMTMPSSPLLPFPSLPMNSSPPIPPAHGAACPKNYTKRDMALALEALKSKKLSLSRASEVYGIPPTTLWQRANRMGIPTPKKDTTSKNWSDEDLESALNALRRKEISANKASKVYKIPSSTLYKIARKEGIELAQPFNAVATTWTQDDLNSALEAIRSGQPVQKAAAEYGIPSGTLYGRCKKVGIELSKHASIHWSEEDMVAALDAVRMGTMSINQAAIHYHLPYSSLYGRINRLKREATTEWAAFRDLPDYSMDQDIEEADHSNGVDYSGFLHAPPDYEDSCELPGGSNGPPTQAMPGLGMPGGGLETSAAALLQSLASQGGH